MGIDWIRRAEERYRHKLQLAGHELPYHPLLDGERQEILTIACHWIVDTHQCHIGSMLTIFYRSDRANLAVLYGDRVVAEVRGEASADLKQLFASNSDLRGLLAVEIVELGLFSEPFYVVPLK